jgi:hypothetical protein
MPARRWPGCNACCEGCCFALGARLRAQRPAMRESVAVPVSAPCLCPKWWSGQTSQGRQGCSQPLDQMADMQARSWSLPECAFNCMSTNKHGTHALFGGDFRWLARPARGWGENRVPHIQPALSPIAVQGLQSRKTLQVPPLGQGPSMAAAPNTPPPDCLDSAAKGGSSASKSCGANPEPSFCRATAPASATPGLPRSRPAPA